MTVVEYVGELMAFCLFTISAVDKYVDISRALLADGFYMA